MSVDVRVSEFRRQERRSLFWHAGTVLAGQLAVMSFGIADTVVAGRYSEDALAALSVGVAIFISVFVTLMGVLQALLPIWAEMHGSNRPLDLGASVRQSLYLCAALTALGMLMLFFPGFVLGWTGIPPELLPDVRAYLGIVALGLPAAMLLKVHNTFNQAIGLPKIVTWLQFSSVLVKVPLTIWFVFGGMGLEPMGVQGCAWATVVDNYAILFLALWLTRWLKVYDQYRFWQRLEPLRWFCQKQFLRLGIPAGLSILVETTSFTMMALFIARQGVVPLAAHQIAANVAAVLYMVPLSLGIAGSARVSYWLGRNEPARARQTVFIALRNTVMFALLLMLLLYGARGRIAALYSGDAAVVATAATLLGGVVLYHLGDAVQIFCVFVLRCWRITISTLLVYSVMLWGVGLGGGYVLAYAGFGRVAPWNSPLAFWIAGAVAQAVAASIFVLMLLRKGAGLPRW